MTDGMRRVAVRVPVEKREQAIAALLDHAPAGFEERDDAGEVEFGIYTDEAGEDRLRAVFPSVASVPVPLGWEDAWRAFHRPVTVGGLWIGPPWLEPPQGVPTVVIDPGRAFGTGAHPTTRLCIELLAGVDRGSLLDIGCGSGVLSIAASRLGFAPIVAVDVDEVAIDVTRANAAANSVELDAYVLDAATGMLPAADVAVANVSSEVVELVLARVRTPVVVTSGYLEGERPCHDGWSRAGTATLEGWAADRFERVWVPRLQGLVRRRAGDPRAPARRWSS
ncbi:MAG: methyltransferase [Deltaproteobacteria bacterium]|nr:MAG: methyltransferase [Deltaproteobacteria bacterium]